MFLLFSLAQLVGEPQLGADGWLPGLTAAGAKLHLGDLPYPEPGQWHGDRFCRLGVGYSPNSAGGTGFTNCLVAVDPLSALEPSGHLCDLADAAS